MRLHPVRSLPALLLTFTLRAQEPTLNLPLGDGLELELVRVSSGNFTQGSPATEPNRGADEAQRAVKITRDFYLGRTAVTVAQWSAFVAETGYRTEAEVGTSGGYGWDGSAMVQRKDFNWRNPGFPQQPDHPVCLVTHPDALAFCAWLSRKSKRAVTLPTEAQWEYASRAGTTTAWHAGDDPVLADTLAWHKGNAGNRTWPVREQPANPWGLRMGGNVAEWCLDWYAPYETGAELYTDPLQTRDNLSDKPRRVLRGGSWARDAKNTRSAARFRADPRSRNADIGFRVVSSLHPVAAVEPAAAAAAASVVTPPPAPQVEPQPVVQPASAHYPTADPEPLYPARHGCGIGGMELVIMAAVVYIILRALFRGRPSGPKPFSAESTAGAAMGLAGAQLLDATRGQSDGVRLVDDGFWVEVNEPAGTRIRYVWIAQGGEMQGELRYQPGPGGHFVYTGRRPDTVRLLGSAGRRDDDADPFPEHRTGSLFGSARHDSPGRRARNPSAY